MGYKQQDLRVPPLDAFRGAWRFSRQITDHLSGAQSEVTGLLRFEERPGGLLYHETGTLKLPGQQPMQAERKYLWHPCATGISVCFEDGRPFHIIARDDPYPRAFHDCAPDRYEAAYDFGNWPAWQSIWHVRGPRKDYISQTSHTRP